MMRGRMVIVMMRVGAGVTSEPDKVDDFHYAERVEDEEYNEPPLLAATGSIPKREPFEDKRPYNRDDDEREEQTA